MNVIIEKVGFSTIEIESSAGAHIYAALPQIHSLKVVNFEDATAFQACEIVFQDATIFTMVSPLDYAANTLFCDINGLYECQLINLVIPNTGDDIAHKIIAILNP